MDFAYQEKVVLPSVSSGVSLGKVEEHRELSARPSFAICLYDLEHTRSFFLGASFSCP